VSALVLDGSATLAWCFEDEQSDKTEKLRHEVRARGAIVPRLWRLEVTNVLVNAERRGRMAPATTASLLGLLGEMPIIIDDETDRRAFGDTLHLARAHDLSTYDAAYLELAMRRALPLATLDRELARAAKRTGVPLPLGR